MIGTPGGPKPSSKRAQQTTNQRHSRETGSVSGNSGASWPKWFPARSATVNPCGFESVEQTVLIFSGLGGSTSGFCWFSERTFISLPAISMAKYTFFGGEGGMPPQKKNVYFKMLLI